jgi:hypothetical protein
MRNADIELIELLDLLDYTFSDDFVEKWRYRFSTKFIKNFQYRILKSLQENKPVKEKSLYLYLTKKCKYAEEQVDDFFEAIDITLYYPMVIPCTAKR